MCSSFGIIDNSGISSFSLIRLLGRGKAQVGQYFLGSVFDYMVDSGFFRDARKSKKFQKGSLHVVYYLRSVQWVCRNIGFFLRFSENCGIIVNKKRIPVASRLEGPVMFEQTQINSYILSMAQSVL